MSAEALVLVITGALLHALWNLFAKKASGGLPFVWLFGVVSTAAALPFGIASLLHDAHQLTAQAWLAVLASATMHIIYSLVLQRGYRESDFSIVYPLARGTGPLFAVLGALVVLGEMPSVAGWIGIGCVLAGLFLISGGLRVLRRSATMPNGVHWGLLTGASIAVYTVVDGWAVKVVGISPVLYYFLGLALRTLMLAPLALRDPKSLRAEWRVHRRYVVAVGLLSPLAYTLVLFAMKLAPLSYVAPVREVSMLLGVFLGARVLREAFNRERAVGAILMVTGVVALAGV